MLRDEGMFLSKETFEKCYLFPENTWLLPWVLYSGPADVVSGEDGLLFLGLNRCGSKQVFANDQ